jgi:hypothetical protein
VLRVMAVRDGLGFSALDSRLLRRSVIVSEQISSALDICWRNNTVEMLKRERVLSVTAHGCLQCNFAGQATYDA